MAPMPTSRTDQAPSAMRGDAVEPLRPADSLLTLLLEQAGRCALCHANLVVPPNAPDELTGVVDRDACTQVVRGLLCHRCHEALALFGADPILLQRAAGYLQVDRTPRARAAAGPRGSVAR